MKKNTASDSLIIVREEATVLFSAPPGLPLIARLEYGGMEVPWVTRGSSKYDIR